MDIPGLRGPEWSEKGVAPATADPLFQAAAAAWKATDYPAYAAALEKLAAYFAQRAATSHAVFHWMAASDASRRCAHVHARWLTSDSSSSSATATARAVVFYVQAAAARACSTGFVARPESAAAVVAMARDALAKSETSPEHMHLRQMEVYWHARTAWLCATRALAAGDKVLARRFFAAAAHIIQHEQRQNQSPSLFALAAAAVAQERQLLQEAARDALAKGLSGGGGGDGTEAEDLVWPEPDRTPFPPDVLGQFDRQLQATLDVMPSSSPPPPPPAVTMAPDKAWSAILGNVIASDRLTDRERLLVLRATLAQRIQWLDHLGILWPAAADPAALELARADLAVADDALRVMQ